jgi:hypothetical protein
MPEVRESNSAAIPGIGDYLEKHQLFDSESVGDSGRY